jgi:hypothetical protein
VAQKSIFFVNEQVKKLPKPISGLFQPRFFFIMQDISAGDEKRPDLRQPHARFRAKNCPSYTDFDILSDTGSRKNQQTGKKSAAHENLEGTREQPEIRYETQDRKGGRP